MSTNTLPDKASALIRVALRDLKACEKDDNYIINMKMWHVSGRYNCEVCMAGAVMAQSLGTDFENYAEPRGFPDDARGKLYALNMFRVGYIEIALQHMGVNLFHEIGLDYREIVGYEDDREKFFEQMNVMADDLERVGV